ncbi:hypothetical protein [Teredinibacter purpureus]|uniref:hypothetical protein n=1 Tax=Teredinibacter purpureus TaxID=2731756 RepID=UPI0005F80EA3|nr:hypothetical protein [Teredinibacter purpureus]
MHVDQYYSVWEQVFVSASISKDVARDEYSEWVSGLDGEIDNEYSQNELSVAGAAELSIAELKESN